MAKLDGHILGIALLEVLPEIIEGGTLVLDSTGHTVVQGISAQGIQLRKLPMFKLKVVLGDSIFKQRVDVGGDLETISLIFLDVAREVGVVGDFYSRRESSWGKS